MPCFDKNNMARPTTSEIFGAFTALMLPKAPFHIGTDTGIKTAVAAQYDINRPNHECVTILSAYLTRHSQWLPQLSPCRYKRNAQ